MEGMFNWARTWDHPIPRRNAGLVHAGKELAMRRVSAIVVVLLVLLVLPAGAVAATPGDEPSTAITASVGTSQYDSSTMTASAADPTSCGEFEDFTNTMWFSYTPTRSSITMVDINSFVSSDGSTDFLAIAFVYAQQPGGSLALVGCGAYPATVFFSARAGTTYLVVSAALGADDTGDPALSDHGGTFDLTITPIRGRVLIDRFHSADSFVDEGLSQECGFEVTVSFDDRGFSKTFLTTSGVRMFTFFVVGSTTFSSADGSRVTLSYAQPFRDTLDGTVQILGLPAKVMVDGKLVELDAGRLVLGPDGIVFEAGPHTIFNEGVDVCALLAG
jgi:hypothetical protein